MRRGRKFRSFRPGLDALERRELLAADLGFTPLASSADVLPVNSPEETTPFDTAPEVTQTLVQRETTDHDLGDNLQQNTINETGPGVGRYLFTAALDGTLNRTDLATGDTIDLLDISIASLQDPTDDTDTLANHLNLQNLSSVRWTPWGTLLVGEAIDENDPNFVPDTDAASAAHGLVYEIVNPTSSQPIIYPRPALGSGNITGIDIDSAQHVYITDSNGAVSTILRFTTDDSLDPTTPVEFGTLEVLSGVSGNLGDAEWAAIDSTTAETDVRAALIGVTASFYDTTRDLEIGHLNLGEGGTEEVLFVAVQGSDQVLAIDLDGQFGDTANPFVYIYMDSSVDPDFNSPVDLSSDASGRLYIGEAINPAPGPGDVGNDVWVAIDHDDDVDFNDVTFGPIANEAGKVASLRVAGAGVNGLYVNPFNNSQVYVNVSGSTSNRDGIYLLTNTNVEGPSVTEIDNGDGNVIVSIVGTENSDSIAITGGNILTIRIGTKIFKGFAPSDTVVVYGLGGSDRIIVNTGNLFSFVVYGGEGSDYITTGAGDDVISGGGGNDRIAAGPGSNVIDGGDGNDMLTGGNGEDNITGGNGNDRIQGDGGNDTVDGGAGNDMVNGGFGDDTVIGGAGNDNLVGYFGNDLLLGGAGSDFIGGGADQDVLVGGDGADALYGGSGDDILSGGAGADIVAGELGEDVLLGGAGADRLSGSAGDDLLIGDITVLDEDVTQLRSLMDLWVFNSFADDRAAQVDAFIGTITADNSRDLLDGGNDDDLIYYFSNKDVVRVPPANVNFPQSDELVDQA
jgi:Ca2+-binding RTX toxin-like protein